MTYSNRVIPGLELVESFDYRFAPPAAASVAVPPAASRSAAASDERMKKHLAALDRAWLEVQEANGTTTCCADPANQAPA